jgi:hypothetical protein
VAVPRVVAVDPLAKTHSFAVNWPFNQNNTGPDAPIPVWARTNCISKPARSLAARSLKSNLEKSQIPAKASGIENRVGLSWGNGAEPLGWPNSATQTAGEKITPASDETNPRPPPMTAPLVVIPFHMMDMKRIGKLHDAAIEKARPIIKATFWSLNAMASVTAIAPRATVSHSGDEYFVLFDGFSFRDYLGIQIMADRCCAR